MPLDTLAIPLAAKTAIQTHLWQCCAMVPTRQTPLRLPHPLYRYLGEQRGGTAHLEDLKPAGWRCFTQGAEDEWMVVDAFETQGKFAIRVHLGRNVAQWVDLIRSIRRKDRWANDRYSMRTLVSPAIYSSALWFAGANGQNQLYALNWNADIVAGRWIGGAEWETAVSAATARAAGLWRNARVAAAPADM
jgi:hypothetical protein